MKFTLTPANTWVLVNMLSLFVLMLLSVTVMAYDDDDDGYERVVDSIAKAKVKQNILSIYLWSCYVKHATIHKGQQ